jgi:hypothetical protein
MKHITYLFGAGASVNAIPIVKGLVTSMKEELNDLINPVIFSPVLEMNSNPFITKELFDNFISDYTWVVNSSEKHQSIDTFAKKLFIQGEFEDLKKLKTIMSIYFIIIQSKKDADKRYDGFFASILQESHLVFPDHLKILSWNYDYQFEKAYSEYSRDSRINSCRSSLNILSKNSTKSSFHNNKFGILKLNATASFIVDTEKKSTFNYFEDVSVKYNSSLISNLLANYASLHHISTIKNKLVPSLSFAWEDYNYGKHIVEKAIEFAKQTEILVIIGYSFPFFNRLVDRDIINSMSNLKKIYFQAPDAELLKERFLAIRDNIKDENLILRKDIEQFAFPNEF